MSHVCLEQCEYSGPLYSRHVGTSNVGPQYGGLECVLDGGHKCNAEPCPLERLLVLCPLDRESTHRGSRQVLLGCHQSVMHHANFFAIPFIVDPLNVDSLNCIII